jgi:hypothetical protein
MLKYKNKSDCEIINIFRYIICGYINQNNPKMQRNPMKTIIIT